MDIDEKVNELLPDLEDYLDRARVQKINEAAGDADTLQAHIEELGKQFSRNRSITKAAIKDLVRRDARKALVALEWLSELVDDVRGDLES